MYVNVFQFLVEFLIEYAQILIEFSANMDKKRIQINNKIYGI